MLSYFKTIVKKYETNIVLALIIILVALGSFEIGLIVNLDVAQQPLIIQNPSSCSESITSYQTPEPTGGKEEKIKKGKLVGSIQGNKYHWPDCPWAQKISPENQIWFSSEKEAQDAGYSKCKNFEKYKPSSY